MKSIILILVIASSAFGQIRIGDWEPDYVWAALKTEPVAKKGAASATESPRAYHVTQLWKKSSGSWKAFAEAAKLKIKAELVGAGWQLKEFRDLPVEEGNAYSFVFEAKKETRGLRFYITLIPVDDQSFYASYVQAAL